MNHIELSICIATRNRANFIGETLESIGAQLTDAVEIVVVDGASTDNTPAIVALYQRRFPQLRYWHLDVNGGVDRDYNRAVELARGKYCWFMTDDDVVKPGALATILHHLQAGYSLLVVNAENRTLDHGEVIQHRRLAVVDDRVYKSTELEELFVDVGHYLTYIGGVVIQRELWQARDRATFFGTWFVHFGVIFQSPLPGDTRVIAEPLIGGRIGNISWSAKSFEIWMIRWPQLIWSLPLFSAIAKSKITPKEPWRSLKALIVSRGEGSYDLENYRRWIEPIPTTRFHKLVYQTIACLPACLLWLILLGYFASVRRHRRTEIYHWLHTPVAAKCLHWIGR